MRLNLSRRSILGAFGGGLALSPTGPALAQAVFETNPFRLGVTAGDPLPDGFVIWTRLAPEPLLARGGMRQAAVRVTWEVATNEAMSSVVRAGEKPAKAAARGAWPITRISKPFIVRASTKAAAQVAASARAARLPWRWRLRQPHKRRELPRSRWRVLTASSNPNKRERSRLSSVRSRWRAAEFREG